VCLLKNNELKFHCHHQCLSTHYYSRVTEEKVKYCQRE
jgi:hypothetical protein